jgi:hypothetical protein
MTSDYQRSRLNIALPHCIRHQLEILAAEGGLSVTRCASALLEEALRNHMQSNHEQTEESSL